MPSRFAIETVFSARDRMTAPITRMQKRFGRMTRSMERGVRKVDRAVGGLVRGMGRAGKAMLKFGGAAVVGIGAATAATINKVAQEADHLAKQSRRLQFPIEELQEWKFVAEQSGVSTEKLDSSLGAFTKRLGEAKGGTGPLVTGLKNINPALLEQLKSTESVAEAFDIYVKAMRDADTATEKAALANAAFSRAGLDLANISANSAATIRALRLEQRQNGVITMEAAMAAEAYNDAMNSLKKAVMGAVQVALLPMLPALTKNVAKMREFVVQNQDLIKTKIQDFVDRFREALVRVIDAVVKFNREYDLVDLFYKTIEVGLRVVQFFRDHGAIVLKVMAGVLAFSAVLKGLIAVMTVVNLVMAANPITLIALAVAALTAGVVVLVTWLWKVIKPLEKIKKGWDAIKGIGSGIADAFGFGDDDDSGQQESGPRRGRTRSGPSPQVVTPQERVARSIEERRSTSSSEITLRPERGTTAEVTRGNLGAGVKLAPTGGL